jgi:hypothetical protein
MSDVLGLNGRSRAASRRHCAELLRDFYVIRKLAHRIKQELHTANIVPFATTN